MGVFGELTGLGKAFWDLGVNGLNGVGEFVRSTGDRPRPNNRTNSKLLKEATGSEILDGGQKVIEGMRLTTGAGEPENGDRFGQGWSGFNDAGETLTSAFPNDSWAGEAADAYIGQNRTQAGRTNAIALLDRGVQTVIAREAYQVAYHRDKLDDQSNFLADLSYVTMALGLVPGYGKAMKATVEAAAVQAALSICSLELYELAREANENAAELHQAVGLYAGAAETPPPTKTGSPSTPPPSPPGGGSPPEGQVRQGPANGGSVAQAPATVPAPPPNSAASPQPPTAAQLPATPAAPADGLAQLGAVLGPLGALLAGATQPAAQMPPGQPPAAPAAAPAAAAKKSTKKKDDDEQDNDTATPGRDEGEAERAPVHVQADADPARLHAPMAVTLNADRPPTPPATTTPPA